jgi:hypothetical protein
VSTFNQKWLPPEYFKGTAYTEAENYDIVTNGRIADTAQFPWAAQYDHMIFWKDTSNWEPPHRFELVFSRRNVDKYIEELKYLNQFIENEQVKQYINVPVFYINLITCNEFKTPDEAIHWDGLNNYDGYNVMFSDCFKMKIYEAWAHSKTKSLARMLGFIPKDLEIIDGTDTLKRFEEIWEANLKSIMFMNSIGIMWMGYADEQKQAKKYLMNYSGKDFDNSEDYFDWWRKQQTE